MPFWNIDLMNDFRVRAAWGTASQSPAPYSSDQTYSSAPVVVDGVTVGGVTPSNIGNPELGPERSTEIEFGLDAGFFGSRVGMTLTYFQKNIRDLIVSRPVAPSTGFAQNQLVNLGEMESKGYEVLLNANILQRENVTLDMTFTHGTYDPIITDLGLDAPIFFPEGADGGSRAAGSQVFQTGFAPGAYVSNVITSATRDENGVITSFELAPGNLGDGTNRRVVGSPWPDAEQTLLTSATLFRNWQVSVLFDRVTGMDMLNVTRAFRSPFSNASLGTDAYGREYAFRQVESTPEQQAMMEQQFFAAFLESGDYVKLREVKVRFALPQAWAARLGASATSLTVSGRNLKTWTDYSGFDPEVGIADSQSNTRQDAGSGVINAFDAYRFPNLRTVTFALSASF